MDLPVVTVIGDTIKGMFGLIDDLHTSDEEKLNAKGKIFASQMGLLDMVLGYERQILEARTAIIVAEAKGDSWLQRTWRPLAMLFLLGLVGAHWFGLTPDNLTEDQINGLFLLVQIGLGGYVVGRSAEKVAKSINFNKAISTKED